MKNLLLEKVEYKIEKTSSGVWRRFLYPNGSYFAEYKSNATWFGLPWFHYTYGKCPETGRRVVAKGVVAIGRLSSGILAIGHASVGVVAVGQLGIGVLFGLGQASAGVLAVGQLAVGVLFGLGQIATGYAAIGQFALGKYVLAQMGYGSYLWSQAGADPEAVTFFKSLLARVTGLW